MRHAGPLPCHPDEDDLVALADAVRERGDGTASFQNPLTSSFNGGGFSDPTGGAPSGVLVAPPAHRPESNGRRRGHLRVLPDPGE